MLGFFKRREITANKMKKNNGSILANNNNVVDQKGYDKILTVRKTSLFFSGDGFAAYGSKGELVFRVDSYGPESQRTGEVVLMDAIGRCILTLRRKRPSLHQRWEGFAGEGKEGAKAVFGVRRSSMIGRWSVTVEMYSNPGEEYQIVGSFASRKCSVYDSENRIVAEIRRKVDSSTNVMLGKDVFTLCVKAGFDAAFAMGLVLVLDRIHGDSVYGYGDGEVNNGSRVGVAPMVEPCIF